MKARFLPQVHPSGYYSFHPPLVQIALYFHYVVDRDHAHQRDKSAGNESDKPLITGTKRRGHKDDKKPRDDPKQRDAADGEESSGLFCEHRISIPATCIIACTYAPPHPL